MADIKQARDRIEHILVMWYQSDPLMLRSMSSLDKVADPSQKTVGIDSNGVQPRVLFNPNFINALNDEQLECVLASEGFKVLLRHCTSRLLHPKPISSLASSITVDQLIMTPLVAQDPDTFPLPKAFGLPEKSFYEDYFRQLLENADKTKQQIQKMWNSMSDEQKKQAMQQAMSGSGTGDGEGGAGGAGGENKDGDGFEKFDNGKKALKEYTNPNSTSNQSWGKNDLFDAQVKQLVDEYKSTARGWGKFSGQGQGAILAAHEPKISYKEVIRRFRTSVEAVASVTSRMKVNRRYDLAQPGYRRAYKTKIIFALDTSGSMSNADLAEGFAVINSVCKHAEITYVLFDVEIQQVEKKLRKAREKFTVKGRGGTSFDHICKMANDEKVDGLVIFTDGESSAPARPKCKTLWLMTSKQHKPPVTWDFVAQLDRFENHI